MKKLTLLFGLLALVVAVPAFAQTAYTTTAYAPTPIQQCPSLWSNLSRGSSDYYTQGQVSSLQRFLSTRYYQPVTGYFGAMTAGNVATFQREQGIYPITGGVGPLTRAAIARVCGGVVPPPTEVSGFSATPTNGQVPLAVAFSINTVTGNDLSSLYIDFGDGVAAKPQTIYCFAAPCIPAMTSQHTYTAAGTYTAKLMRDNNYCAPGNYCAQIYREPTVLGTIVISVTGGSTSPTVTANPMYGPAPLTVAFSPGSYAGPYAIDFGDGTSASQVTGMVTHTYASRGAFTAQLQSDPACRHQTPFCAIATMNLGSVTVVAY